MPTAGATIASMVKAAAATTDAAAGRPIMVIMPTATMIVTAGRTAANTTKGTPVSTTTYTRAADILLADTPLADTPLAGILLADIPQADTPLAAVSTRGNL